MRKAYMIMYNEEDWCDFTHADNRQEAKILFWKVWGYEGEFIDIRVRREPMLDNLPLTGKNIVHAGYDENWLNEKSYICKCSLCANP